MTKVRPQDDFFQYVNSNWIRHNPIPHDESRWGAFVVLRHEVEKQIKKIVETTTDRKIRDLYHSGMNMKLRNALGMEPLRLLLTRIERLNSRINLAELIAYLETMGIGVPFHTTVDQDAKDSTRYILYLEQGGLGMPDRDYYLKNTVDQKRVREAYQKHIVSLLLLVGRSADGANDSMRTVMQVETALATASMDKVSLRDPDKTYHKKSLATLKRHAPAIDWNNYVSAIGAPKLNTLILSQPRFMKEVNRLAAKLPLEDWKIYLTFHVINSTASILSQDFVDENFSFYGKVLSGQRKMKPLWRRTVGVVNTALGELVGKVYVRKYFSPRAKRVMDRLVDDLFKAFEKRLKNLEWMTPTTKMKALNKLHAITRKIGYPSRWKNYSTLSIDKNDFVGNVTRANLFEHRRSMRKIGKGVERHEWFMTPQTVNAYYSPTMNEIVFPAAILQSPFFGLSADDAVNYGAIGSVIGHEITHGFDDQGAKFDERGNLKRWWNTVDQKRFEARSRRLTTQYDRYEAAPGAPVNGRLTLGENIADLGGLAIAYDAYQRRFLKTGRKMKGGMTPEQRFFIGWAAAEREHARHEYLKMIVAVDPHAPAPFRINGPLSNFSPFYEAFGVAEGDRLYRDPKDRAIIW